MSDIFDDINAIISGDSTIIPATEVAEDDAVMHKISARLAALSLPQVPAVKAAPAPERKFDKYWTDTNILVPQILDEFRAERIMPENETFTEPVPTTFTIEGNVSNVKFMEEELINEVEPCSDIVIFDCNYGKKIYPGYTQPQKIKKSNRGRRKVEKQKKPRKKQGNGSAMSSQLTFVTRSRECRPELAAGLNIIPADTRVYKFKIFRNGKIQLPGAKPEIIDDIISCARIIEDKLNDIFPEKLIALTHLNAVMKNYKFCLKLLPGQIINFAVLQNLVMADIKKSREMAAGPIARPSGGDTITESTINQNSTDILDTTNTTDTPLRAAAAAPSQIIALMPPKISHIKYTRMSVNFSIIFDTPREFCPDKTLRVKIWQGGKINILGGLEVKYTREICEYLRTLFLMHPELIVTPPKRKVIARKKYIARVPNVQLLPQNDHVHIAMPTSLERVLARAFARVDIEFAKIPGDKFLSLLE